VVQQVEVARLESAWDRGDLIAPNLGDAHFVDLIRAIAHVTGVPDIELSDHGRAFAGELSTAEHLVLVLSDGLGLDCIHPLDGESWLRGHLAGPLQAVFPPTTSAALTTLASGEWPATHAVPGWWTYLPRLEQSVRMLPFDTVHDGTDLASLDVTIDEAFPAPALIPRNARDSSLVMPQALVNTPFTRYIGGDAERVGYATHAEAAHIIAERIAEADGPTFTYWYTPMPDHLLHRHGPSHEAVDAAILDLDSALAGLDESLADIGRPARVVVTADHGHLEVGPGEYHPISPGAPVLATLRCPPSGDVRTLYWHVREGQDEAFRQCFERDYGQHAFLLSTDQVEQLGLFGPESLSVETRARIGDYTSIAIGGVVMRWSGAPDEERFKLQRSHHSGLSEQEMRIPLILGERHGETVPSA
jgi:hypothetical protein